MMIIAKIAAEMIAVSDVGLISPCSIDISCSLFRFKLVWLPSKDFKGDGLGVDWTGFVGKDNLIKISRGQTGVLSM